MARLMKMIAAAAANTVIAEEAAVRGSCAWPSSAGG